MATLSLSIGGVTSSKTIAAADVTRLQNAIKTRFNLGTSPTSQQLLDAVGGWVFAELVDIVKGEERKAAVVADVLLT